LAVLAGMKKPNDHAEPTKSRMLKKIKNKLKIRARLLVRKQIIAETNLFPQMFIIKLSLKLIC